MKHKGVGKPIDNSKVDNRRRKSMAAHMMGPDFVAHSTGTEDNVGVPASMLNKGRDKSERKFAGKF